MGEEGIFVNSLSEIKKKEKLKKKKKREREGEGVRIIREIRFPRRSRHFGADDSSASPPERCPSATCPTLIGDSARGLCGLGGGAGLTLVMCCSCSGIRCSGCCTKHHSLIIKPVFLKKNYLPVKMYRERERGTGWFKEISILPCDGRSYWIKSFCK